MYLEEFEYHTGIVRGYLPSLAPSVRALSRQRGRVSFAGVSQLGRPYVTTLSEHEAYDMFIVRTRNILLSDPLNWRSNSTDIASLRGELRTL